MAHMDVHTVSGSSYDITMPVMNIWNFSNDIFSPPVQYVLRDTSRSSSSKEKSTYLLVPRRDEQLQTASTSGAEILEENSGMTSI